MSRKGTPKSGDQDLRGEANPFPCAGPIHLLDDDPARDDELGAHAGLANAIAHLIESEPGGRAVALEGAWGGGKSTVIELLRAALEERHKGRVFIFDGWAHEGDSLRRALVESFSRWAKTQMSAEGRPLVPTSEKKWLKAKVEGATRRRTTQRIRENVRLAPWGRLMVILLSLVPLGVALASKATGSGHDIGIILAVLPAFLLFCAAAWVWGRTVPRAVLWLLIPLLAGTVGAAGWGLDHWSVAACTGFGVLVILEAVVLSAAAQGEEHAGGETGTENQNPSEGGRRGGGESAHGRWDRFDDVLGIFIRQLRRETKTRGWSTPEPTSIEFAETFRDLLQHVLQWMGDGEKLVVVLDNLDRLPGKQAMRAFATLRGLFEPERASGNRPGWMKDFWLLVPFDPQVLRASAVASNGVTPELPPESGADAVALGAVADYAWLGGDGAGEFRDKFFQVRFRLPLPVLVRWREYLKSCLRKALPAHDDPRLHDDICNLFERTQRDGPVGGGPDPSRWVRYTLPTPRDIKAFVNRLVAIHALWPCEKADHVPATAGEGDREGLRGEPIPLILQAGFALCEAGPDEGDLSARVPGPGPKGERFFAEEDLRIVAGAPGAERIGGAGWERHVAAMWYGLPQGAALHMLFAPQIYRDFLRGDKQGEVTPAARKVPGFWNVARKVSGNFIGGADDGAFARCSRVLSVLARWRDDSRGWHAEWERSENDAIQVLRRPQSVIGSNTTLAAGQEFAEAIAVGEAALELANAGLQSLSRFQDQQTDSSCQMWARATAEVMDAMAEKRWDPEGWSIEPLASPKPFIYLAAAVDERPALEKALEKWLPSDGPRAVVAEIHRALSGTQEYRYEFAVAFQLLARLHAEWGWGELLEIAVVRLRGAKGDPRAIEALADGLFNLAGNWKNSLQFERLKALRAYKTGIENALGQLRPASQGPQEGLRKAAAHAVKQLEWVLDVLG